MADITPIVPLTGELAMPEKVWMQGPPGPQGPKGDTGAAATVTVGTVTTGEPGTDAIVTNSGTESAAVINFTIPRGATGAVGAAGPRGPKGDTGATGPAGEGVPDGGTVGQLLGKTETGTAWIDPPQSGVQSDWNQNDETAADYVKNRPFWREKTKELMFPYITEPIDVTTEDNGSGFFVATGDFDIIPGVTNYVLFDGVEYACEPNYDETAGEVGIGSYDFSDYPFFIAKNIISTKTAGNHTVLQYFYVYTIQTEYAPHFVIVTGAAEDKTPYLAMDDVEKIKVAFKNGVPITLSTSYGNTGFTVRVDHVSESFIYTSGFGLDTVTDMVNQAKFKFSVSDGSLESYSVSYSGSITENGNTYPLMYINNRRYKITVDDSGTLTATEVT